jgi:hypothetical protein
VVVNALESGNTFQEVADNLPDVDLLAFAHVPVTKSAGER